MNDELKMDCAIISLILLASTVIIFALTMKISHISTGEWFNVVDITFFVAWSFGCILFIVSWVRVNRKRK